jgi:hypothetical protein
MEKLNMKDQVFINRVREALIIELKEYFEEIAEEVIKDAINAVVGSLEVPIKSEYDENDFRTVNKVVVLNKRENKYHE